MFVMDKIARNQLIILLFIGLFVLQVHAQDGIRVSRGPISFILPSEMEETTELSLDSRVWSFRDKRNGTLIQIESGKFAKEPAIYKDETQYSKKKIKVDGRRATLIQFVEKTDDSDTKYTYFIGLFVRDLGPKRDNLSFVSYCGAKDCIQRVLGIYQSIYVSQE